MICNAAIRNLVREKKTHQILSVMQSSTTSGMQTLDDSLLHLFRTGKIDRETARKYAIEPERMGLSSGSKKA
jgi:twitching motility protein PilT